MTTRDFLFALPAKVDPAAIEGLETIFHFDIEGEQGGAYTITLADQQVTVTDGFQGEPKCVVRAKDEHFSKLVTGELNPMMAVLTGKVKISNQGEMIRFAKIFGLM